MRSFLFIETLRGIPEHRAWHGRGIFVKEFKEPGRRFPPGGPQPSTSGFLNEVFFVAKQDLGDLERIVYIALTDKKVSADNGRASLPHIF